MAKKQWISILLCLVFVLALLPASPVHADGKVGYTVLGDSISFGFGLEENNSWGRNNLQPDANGQYILYKRPVGGMPPDAFPTLVANAVGVTNARYYHNLSRCSFRTVEMLRVLSGRGSDYDNQMSGNALSNQVMSYNDCGMTEWELNDMYQTAADSVRSAKLVTVELGSNDVVYAVTQRLGGLTNPLTAVSAVTSAYQEAYQIFSETYPKLIQKVYELNPECTVVAVGLYNPFRYLRINEGSDATLGAAMEGLVNQFNDLIRNLNGYANNSAYDYRYADASNAEITPFNDTLSGYLSRNAQQELLDEFNLKMHCNRNGHRYIASQVLAALGSGYNAMDPTSVSRVGNFRDVAANAYYANPVKWAVGNGITSGTSGNTFSPDQTITRAQAVTMIWRAVSSPEPKATNNPFTDVKGDQYYYKAVLWAYENNVTTGTASYLFSPNDPCTRAQIVTFMYNAVGKPWAGFGGNSFRDVPSNAYYYSPVQWAVRQGITAGTGDGTFSPDAPCTRAQVVTFLWRVNGSPV